MANKQKILIVDDDENIAELISLYMTKECFETQIVYDGESALQAADTFAPDLILLDLDHPTTRPSYDPLGAVAYSATGRSVTLTMVQGRILYENGAFTTIDLEQAYQEAEGYAKPLVLEV